MAMDLATDTVGRVFFQDLVKFGVACTFEQVATLGEFTSCLRYATHFTAMATDLNPATPWQIEVYAQDLTPYAAARILTGREPHGPKRE